MENTKYGKRREGRWTPIRAKAQHTRANPNSWETHLVRKRWDIGLLLALSLRIMMMMMMMNLGISLKHKYNTATKRGYPMERIFQLIGSLGFTFSLFHYFIFSFIVICFSFIFNLSPNISFISYNFKVGSLSKLCLALLFSLSL